MNKNKILDFIKKNKVAVGAVGSILAVGILAGIGFGVHKLTNNNDNNTLAVESNKEDKPHENTESNESTASLNNEQATADNAENKAEDNKEATENKENNSADKNVSSESEQKDSKNQNNNKSESNKGVNAGIEISEGKTDNKVNKPSTGSTQNTDKAPSHSHSWKAVTKVVHHKEQGHYENELVKPAWTENIPVYEERARDICNDCNKDLTDLSSKEFKEHGINHIKNGGKGSWRTEWKKVQVGTKPVKHDAVYKKKWVVDKKAYDETITSYKCSCGATK